MPDAHSGRNYHPAFCEENIWHLASDFAQHHPEIETQVLFLINLPRSILLKNQTPFGKGNFGCWDYHVLMLDCRHTCIFDFDSAIGFQTPMENYFESTFPDQDSLSPEFRTTIRSIKSEDYRKSFWSDRSHMLDEQGNPLSKFPPWPAILGENDPLRLTDLYDSTYQEPRIRDENPIQFLERFSHGHD